MVEDLSFEPLHPARFQATITGLAAEPQYKHDGYFIFSNLKDDNNGYEIEISGNRLQTFKKTVPLPFPPIDPLAPGDNKLGDLLIDSAGDNELIVVVTAIDNAANKISFAPRFLAKEIRAGVRVLANGLSTTLAETLEPRILEQGGHASAVLDSVAGLNQNDIVRIVRERSLRTKFDPYYDFPFKSSQVTRIFGKVTVLFNPTISGEAPISLEGANIRITEINGQALDFPDVAGVSVATVTLNGKKIVVGAEKDISTFSTARGDYHLYFHEKDFTEKNGDTIVNLLQSIKLEAKLKDYADLAQQVTIVNGQKEKLDFKLSKI